MELKISRISDEVLKSIAIKNDDGDKVLRGEEIKVFNVQATKAVSVGLVTEEAFKKNYGTLYNRGVKSRRNS